MTLDIAKSLDIIEKMENYISKVRPAPEIRNEIDISYEINDQSVVLNEVRPSFINPQESNAFPYAKATFVKSKNHWKVFWKRSDNKWYNYKPQPEVKSLKDFLKLVDEDKNHCFKG